jgi:Ser/Thr protein kinase RdoA (MazF antagonist)
MRIPDDVLGISAARFGLATADLKLLGGVDGAAYEFARGGQPFVLKVAPTSADALPAIRAKQDFIRYLGENGVRVSRPVPSAAGALVETVERNGQIWAVSAATKAVGRHPVDRDASDLGNPALVREWGRTIGQMHRLTKGYEPTGPIGDWRGEYEFMVVRCPDRNVRSRWREMGSYLVSLPTPPDAFGLVHNDLHQWNYVVSGPADAPEITVFDFDVSNRHWFVAELGLAVFHALWEGPENRLRDRGRFARWFLDELLAGYLTENELSDFWIAQIPRFVEYRRLLLYSVFAGEWNESGNPWLRKQANGWRDAIVSGVPWVEL